MIEGVSNQLIHLVTSLIVVWLVWRYYRDKHCVSAERYATFWPRFWTGSVDSLVLWPIGFSASLMVFFNVSASIVAAMMFVDCIALSAYTVLMHARYGQTVGKMVTQVKVLDYRTEGRVTFWQALLREGVPIVLNMGFLGCILFAVLAGSLAPEVILNGEKLAAWKPFWFFAALPFLWFLAEILTMLTNDKRRALHDFIAGTIVVRTNTADMVPLRGEEYPANYPIACARCGATIAAFAVACEKCGWSYKEGD